MPWVSPSTQVTDHTVIAAEWNELVNNFLFLKRVGLATFNADVTLNTTTVGTAVQIVSLGAITYENVPHILMWRADRIISAATVCNIVIRDGTTVIGTVNRYPSGADTSPWIGWYPITPTAASHTYNLAGWVESASSWVVKAGSGGTAGNDTTHSNGALMAWRVPT